MYIFLVFFKNSTVIYQVGLIDANGRTDRPARALQPALSGGVYSLCWAERDQLLAAANGELVLYNTSKPDQRK